FPNIIGYVTAVDPDILSLDGKEGSDVHIRLLAGEGHSALISPVRAVSATITVQHRSLPLKAQPHIRIDRGSGRTAPRGGCAAGLQPGVLLVAIVWSWVQ